MAVTVIPAKAVREGELRRFYHRNDIDDVRDAESLDHLEGQAHSEPLVLRRGRMRDWFALVDRP